MKTTTIHTVVKNLSRYPIDTVWENAQDLEHVTRLHSNTNKAFELLYTEKDSDCPWEYRTLIYRAVRRGIINLSSFGFRRIISDYNLHQVEFIPALGMRSSLNSLLYKNNDSEFPTMMVDEVVITLPFFFAPLKNFLVRSLHRHAKIQCQEDEPFRARRTLLKEKEIHRPFRVFAQSTFQKQCAAFTLNLENPPS